MKNKPLIVTLCGSTRFKDEFIKWNYHFTKAGAIVLMPGVFHHCGDEMTEEQGEMIRKLHYQKIRMSDLVVIVNKDNYIGDATKKEIELAKMLDIPIIYCYHEDDKEEKELTK